MLKLALVASLLNSLSIPYLQVERIEAYQNNESVKWLNFQFDGTYNSFNNIGVRINVYNNDEYQYSFYNELKFIGHKSAVANIDVDLSKDYYVLIDIYQGENLILENVRINFYFQNDCYFDAYNQSCKRVYKSEYVDKKSKDIYDDMIINKSIFSKYLITNKLNLEEIKFGSEYSFDNSSSVLFIKEKIEGYDIYYNNGYIFPLLINNDKYKYFSLLNDYYVNVIDFKFDENNQYNLIKTTSLHFPFSNYYKEYKCLIIIEDYINYYIEFNLATDGNLFGECRDSKFCLRRNTI